MSRIDVSAEIDIAAEPTDVAGVMFDPHREPEWLAAVRSVEVLDRAIRPGARVRRTAAFMGRDLAWTTEVVSFQFPHALELRVAEGPFAGQVAYQVGRAAGGSVARIRGVGDPVPAGSPAEPGLADRVRAELTAGLERLKALVEDAAKPR
jgi:hypothetical protein